MVTKQSADQRLIESIRGVQRGECCVQASGQSAATPRPPPGSIGCSAWPSRVIKGKKMPGRMGNDTVLKKNVIVVDVRADENVVLLKGPVPGAKNGLLKIFSK